MTLPIWSLHHWTAWNGYIKSTLAATKSFFFCCVYYKIKFTTYFKYLVDLSWGGRNSEKSLHESDLLDKHPSLVFMALNTKGKDKTSLWKCSNQVTNYTKIHLHGFKVLYTIWFNTQQNRTFYVYSTVLFWVLLLVY